MTPKLLAIPFAKDGNKNTIQDERQPAQDANEATWSGGFPPVTMQAKTDGGLPPQGLDFNGIFHDVSSHTVYSCMGGQYKFSAEYAEKIGGYPKGAILLNDEENRRYISTNDKNKSNFNEPKFTGWLVISIADIDKLLDAKADNTDIAESLNKKADKDTSVKAGNGLSGGGTLDATRTITLGAPSTITENSKNTVTTTSHTHEIQKATTSQSGIVQLSSALSNETDKAATPKAVNDVNIVATNAQKSANAANDKANQANAAAAAAMNEAQKKRSSDDSYFRTDGLRIRTKTNAPILDILSKDGVPFFQVDGNKNINIPLDELNGVTLATREHVAEKISDSFQKTLVSENKRESKTYIFNTKYTNTKKHPIFVSGVISMPDSAKYTPKIFVNNVLTQEFYVNAIGANFITSFIELLFPGDSFEIKVENVGQAGIRYAQERY